ncbi:MAG: PorV/PorQ family protein [Elusimicrobia bacterium]|nr:PorV/PorQ family protein [Candidatus Liberimonas magnetica]
MKKALIISSIFLISVIPTFAAGTDAGTSTAVFLRMEQGARALGMGGAYVAMDKDIESVWWNPAALTFTDGMQLHFAYSDYISDLMGSYAAISIPAGKNVNSSIILDVNYISMGNLDARDGAGTVIKTISLNSLVGGIGYSFPATSNISFGAHAKYFQQNLGDYSAASFVADAGLLYKFSRNLNFGVCAQNIGQKIKISDVENQLPMNITAGLAYMVSPKIIFTADEEMPNDADSRFHIGSEYRMSDSFFLRAGYNASDSVGFSAGAGFLTPVVLKTQSEGAWWKEAVNRDWKHNVIRIDYAYISSAGNLEATHRISATFKF